MLKRLIKGSTMNIMRLFKKVGKKESNSTSIRFKNLKSLIIWNLKLLLIIKRNREAKLRIKQNLIIRKLWIKWKLIIKVFLNLWNRFKKKFQKRIIIKDFISNKKLADFTKEISIIPKLKKKSVLFLWYKNKKN